MLETISHVSLIAAFVASLYLIASWQEGFSKKSVAIAVGIGIVTAINIIYYL